MDAWTSKELFDWMKEWYCDTGYPSKDIVSDIILKAGSYTQYVDDIMLIDDSGREVMRLRDFADELLMQISDRLCDDFGIYG